MKKIFLFAHFFAIFQIGAQQYMTEDEYIQKFAPYAVEEMEKYKIPASITLAQGLLETGGGQSDLAILGNNHFGIKCKEDWAGKTMRHTDDAPNECFRVYDDPKQSYEDHSIFLATRKYYTKLFDLDPKDYRAWAHGLKKAGYATNPRYAHILIDKIEKYQLYLFDNISENQVDSVLAMLYPNFSPKILANAQPPKNQIPPPPPPPQVSPLKEIPPTKTELLSALVVKNHPNGQLKYVVSTGDLSMADIAKKYKIKESKLLSYNDLSSPQIKKNQIVFLEKKENSGNQKTYTAQIGDTMYMISQKFAVKLAKLYKKNRMQAGQKITPNQIIYLKSKKPRP